MKRKLLYVFIVSAVVCLLLTNLSKTGDLGTRVPGDTARCIVVCYDTNTATASVLANADSVWFKRFYNGVFRDSAKVTTAIRTGYMMTIYPARIDSLGDFYCLATAYKQGKTGGKEWTWKVGFDSIMVRATDKTGYSLAGGTQTFNMTGNITGNLSGSVASVGSAVNINSNTDITAIKTHTDSIAIDSNRVRSDMWAIDRQRTSGYMATLKLKKLDIYNKTGTAVMIESDVGSAVDIGAYGSGDAGVLISSTAGPGMDISGGQDAVLISGGMDGIDIDATHGHAVALNGGDTTSSVFINGGTTGWGFDILGFNLNTGGRVQFGGQGDTSIKVGDANNGKIGGIFNNDSLWHKIALASDSAGTRALINFFGADSAYHTDYYPMDGSANKDSARVRNATGQWVASVIFYKPNVPSVYDSSKTVIKK